MSRGNPVITFRAPQELHSRAKTHMEETGLSQTELMLRALEEYLDNRDEDPF